MNDETFCQREMEGKQNKNRSLRVKYRKGKDRDEIDEKDDIEERKKMT